MEDGGAGARGRRGRRGRQRDGRRGQRDCDGAQRDADLLGAVSLHRLHGSQRYDLAPQRRIRSPFQVRIFWPSGRLNHHASLITYQITLI